jgi:AraC-like DNA-binding protein
MENLLKSLLPGSIIMLAFFIFAIHNKVNKAANFWFGLFVLSVFGILSEDFFKINKLVFIEFVSNISCFLVAPFFYLSISFYTNPLRKFHKKDFLHFVYAFIFSLFLIYSLIQLSDKTVNETSSFSISSLLFILVFVIQLMLYTFYSLKKIRKHQKSIELFSSNTDKINLKWLQDIVYGVLLLIVFWAFDLLFGFSELIPFPFFNLLILVSVYYIAYKSINQKDVFSFDESQKKEILDIIENTEIKKKLISDEKLDKLKIELLYLMESKKLFLDSELNLIKLSSLSDIPIHQLSYTINNGFNENFFIFVNQFRIEEAKKLLLDPEMNYLSILGIGFEVGFKSKTVFNTTFKKITGITPTEFKNNHK